MVSLRKNLYLVACLALLASCGLEQEIELELPPYEPQPSLEFYLTPGEPFRALLTTTSGFFDPLEVQNDEFVQNILIDSADIRVRWGDEEVLLTNFEVIDPRFAQVFNYAALDLVPDNYVDSFYLDAVLPDGRTITAATLLRPAVPTDSITVEYPDGLTTGGDTLARIITYITDPESETVNRFFRVLTYDLADSSALSAFVFTDEFNDQASIPVATVFFFEPGDTVYNISAQVDAGFESYYNSVQLADASNGNPFAQPSPLLGNLRGTAEAIGVFAPYAYVVDTILVPEP